MVIESTLLVLLLILLVGLVVSELFEKLRISYVTSLIIMGAILGVNGLGYVQPNATIEFIGFLGFTFLMFMAGLEIHTDYIRKHLKEILLYSFLNGGIPFAIGIAIARFAGYDWLAAAIVGTVFISSSVAIIVPIMKENRLLKKNSGQIFVSSIVIQDALSLIVLAVLFQSAAQTNALPLPLPGYIAVLLIVISSLYIFLPKIAASFIKKRMLRKHQEHEDELRFTVVTLIGTLLLFEVLGVHPILAAFFVGALLSSVINSKKLYAKLHAIGYGFFIPLFFFIAGTDMDLKIFTSPTGRNSLVIVIIVSVILSKFLSGYLAGKVLGFKNKVTNTLAALSTTQLTTTLAATFAARSADLIDSTLSTAIIAVSIVTTIIGPTAAKWLRK